MRVMKSWEIELYQATIAYVDKQCPGLPDDKRQDIIVRIYADMRRTLKLFHKDDTS